MMSRGWKNKTENCVEFVTHCNSRNFIGKNTCIVKIQKELLILIPSILPSLFHRVSNIILQLKCNLISRLFDHSTFLSWWLHRESSRYSFYVPDVFKKTTVSFFVFQNFKPSPKKVVAKACNIPLWRLPTWLYLLRLLAGFGYCSAAKKNYDVMAKRVLH